MSTIIGNTAYAASPSQEDFRVFETQSALNTYLDSARAKAGQTIKLKDAATGKYKAYIIQGTAGSFTTTAMSGSYLVAAALPEVANADVDTDYYIGSAAAGYTHYRLVNGAFVAVGRDSYTKTEVDNIIANSNAMKLADASLTNINVPASNGAPNTASEAYVALPVGQIFVCTIDDEQTFWIKKSASSCVNISQSGSKFNSGRVDDDGNLHLTLDGADISTDDFQPFYIGNPGSGTTSAGISLTNVIKPSSIRNGTNAVFSFTATETGDQDITVKWYVDNVLIETQEKASGSLFSFNAKNYLKPSDTSSVKAAITSVGGAALNRTWNVTSTAFSISWGSTIYPVTLYTANENVYVVVNVSAQDTAENVVTLTIGEYSTSKNAIGSRALTFEVTPDKFTTGVNTVTASMAASANPSDVATPISYQAVWAYGAAAPIVAFADDTLSAAQYDTATINYLAYDPNNETASCTMTIGTDAPRSLNANRTMQSLSYIPQTYGNITATLACGTASDTMTISVSQSQYNIGMITGDNLRYNLDPVGHSNSDADKTSFGNLSFSSGFDWVNGGFWTDGDGAAFVVKKGHRATLPRQIFGDADGNGKTIDLSFKIKNSDLYDAVAMQEVNNGASKGVMLRANEGELRLNNTTGQIFRYCEENRIDMSINVEAINDQRVMTVWLDGIPALVNEYSANTLVQTENSLVIGSDHCDVWIYAIHIYNTSLSFKEMIQNYISLAPTTSQKVARCQKNDIYTGNTITKEALHAACPDLTIVTIEADMIPLGKSKSNYVNANVTIQDGSDILTLGEGTKYRLQGTSSLNYMRSCCNLDINFADTGKTYKLSSGAIPVNYLNIKVNVASSENANNVCAADEYNTYQPYIVPARATAGVRDTIEGKPCAVFFKNTSGSTIWASSQQVAADQTILYAMGDLCNSKNNLAVFGQDGTGEHYAKGCVEVSGNDTPAQQFKATSTYNYNDDEWQSVIEGVTKKDFEWRAEPKSADKTEVINAWNTAVAWVVSTDTTAATNSSLSQSVTYDGVPYTTDSAAYRLAKFKAEVGNYFALDSLLYHFLYLEYFAALDNVSKNTFYSYEYDATANKYLWNICKNYDDDTILGCDNDGKPLVDYGIDYDETIAGGRSPFNVEHHPIWSNIQQGLPDELAAMYITLRGRGAFNATSIINKFDTYQAKRPHAAMAQDAYNKYILPAKTTNVVVGTEVKSYDTDYLARLQGSKTYPRKQFLTYQSKYMDGKYGYYVPGAAITFRANAVTGTTEDLTVEAYAKTWVTLVVDNGTKVRRKIAKGGSAVFNNTTIHSNATLYFSPESVIESITPLNVANLSTFAATGAMKLQDVTLGSALDTNTAWDANTTISIPSPILKTFSIRNITNFSQALNLSANSELTSVDTRGTQAGMITLPSYAPLTSVTLNACSGIKAANLSNVTTFSLANGNNLTSVNIENCNSVINNAMLTYLSNAVSAGGNITRRIRLTGVNWALTDATFLKTIALNWQGYDALGAETATPVITGTATIPSITSDVLETLHDVFPNLTITPNEVITSHLVTYVNADDESTVLYQTYVVQGQYAPDPYATGALAEMPTIPDDEQYTYSFGTFVNDEYQTGSGWDTLSGVISAARTVTAVYTSTPQVYTVTWYSRPGVSLGSVTANYGSEVVYQGDTPTNAASESSLIYNVFAGWDKSTGFIRGNTDVYAVWQTADLGATQTAQPDLSEMTPAQVYAVTKSGQASSFFTNKDYIDVTLGHDFDFAAASGATPQPGNVAHSVLTTGVKLDGTAPIDTGIKLFDENEESFTIAIDFQFSSTTQDNTLLGCYKETGAEGFRLCYNGSPKVQWGDASQTFGYQKMRDMLVLRHTKGSPYLYMYASNGTDSSSNFSTSIFVTQLTRSRVTSTDSPLVLGGVKFGDGSYGDAGSGYIHWCKLWYDDLGDANCRKLAAWYHETIRMEYCGNSRYKLAGDTALRSNASFICNHLLEGRGQQMETSDINTNGWGYTDLADSENDKSCKMRTFCNTRLYAAIPEPWKFMMKKVKIYASAGNKSTTVVYSEDYIYIPATVEMNNSNDATLAQEGTYIAWYTSDNARVKFRGIATRDGASYFSASSDPSTDSSNTVLPGDVWKNGNNLYVYVPQSYLDKFSITPSVAASIGGGWMASSWYWLRSPHTGGTTTFLYVYTLGGVYDHSASNSYGVCPCFSI